MARGYLAIDLGAGSGRVMLGVLRDGALTLHELHRFRHGIARIAGHDRWLFADLTHALTEGLAAAARQELLPTAELRSIGVDAWGVDYGLLDGTGALLADPICYRDARTDGMLEPLFAAVPRAELYRRTGIQCMPINTSVQLFAEQRAGEWPALAQRLLLIPDLVHHWLCGSTSSEITNASTTQLLTAATRTWDLELLQRLHIPAAAMPPLVPAGTALGTLRPELAAAAGLPPLPIVAPATHDTGSAVAGTPLADGWAYISSGTWSLVGVETSAPVLTDLALQRNVTNEAGVYGTNRLLKNVMGLWLLDGCMARWREQSRAPDLDELQRRLLPLPPATIRIDPDDARFLHPPDMPAAIQSWLTEHGQSPIDEPFALAHVVLTSLAQRYAEIVRWLGELTGRRIAGVHIVGGGSRNHVQAQLCADLTGLPVRTGPVEATALGNVMVQAIADGAFADLATARVAAAAFVEREFRPRR